MALCHWQLERYKNYTLILKKIILWYNHEFSKPFFYLFLQKLTIFDLKISLYCCEVECFPESSITFVFFYILYITIHSCLWKSTARLEKLKNLSFFIPKFVEEKSKKLKSIKTLQQRIPYKALLKLVKLILNLLRQLFMFKDVSWNWNRQCKFSRFFNYQIRNFVF